MTGEPTEVVVDLTGETEREEPADVILGDPDAPAPVPAAAEQPDGLPEQAVQQQDGSLVFKLLYPQVLKFRTGETVREERYDTLTLHRMNGAQMRKVANAGGGTAQALMLLSCSTRLSHARCEALWDRMDAADLGAATECLSFLLRGGRRTGR